MTKEEKLNLYRLDDIGFIGIPSRTITENDWKEMAQIVKESKKRRAMQKGKTKNGKQIVSA